MDSDNYKEYHKKLNDESIKEFGKGFEDISYDKKLEIIEIIRKKLNGKSK
jgi:hypothetical protein